MKSPFVLLVTNSRDLATDHIVVELRRRNASYLRLDLDLLSQDEISLDPCGPRLSYALQGTPPRDIPEPSAILYRAPTHLRESSGHHCQQMPFILQRYVEPKIDLRVTVAGEACFVAETSEPVMGDWRTRKGDVHFRPSHADGQLVAACIRLVRELGLSYGAIDLVRGAGGDCYFLEINPTGEWAWLDLFLKVAYGVRLWICSYKDYGVDVPPGAVVPLSLRRQYEKNCVFTPCSTEKEG